LKKIPAQVFVLLFAVPLGLYFDMDHGHNYRMFAHNFHVGPEYLVSLPSSLLDGITYPDFGAITSGASIRYIVMFTLVGSIESVLSLLAVDALDPRKQASNLNRDLFGVGVGNLICASIGGLPMITEIVRSKANIDAGANSARSNFAHGAFLLLAVGLVPSVLHQIPLAALGAMLVYTGSRLASPGEILHVRALGRDQLLLFSTTLLVTLATDLLLGVGVGLTLKIVLHWRRGASIKTLWGSTVESSREESKLLLKLHGAATFSVLLKVKRILDDVTPDIKVVEIDMSDTALIDHTFLSRVRAMSNEWTGTALEFVGMDDHSAASSHPFATRRKIAV
jgi:MFS superfamily sulfate permease-like transporter